MKAWFGGAAIAAAVGAMAIMMHGSEPGAAQTPPPVQPAAPIVSRPVAHPPRAVDYRLIDERMRRLVADPRMVGIAIGIVEDGQITYLRGYGETLRGSGLPVTADTVFRWASVSKGVASTLVADLAADGKLALTDPANRYAASLRLAGGAEAKATVADILSHRLGIHSNAQDPALEDLADVRLLRGQLQTLPLICPVGSCFSYQNVAYDASSEIVEKVTGKPYAAVAAERLFEPLGMTSASVTLAGLVSAPSWAHPHGADGRPQQRGLSQAYYNVPAAGGVNSSIRDLARWMQAQMGEAPIALPARTLQAIHAPRVPTPGETRRQRKFRERIASSNYALGWRNYDYAGRRLVGHHGGISGYRASILFDPVKKSGLVALWNSGSGKPWGFEYEVMDMIQGLDRRDWMGLDTPPGQALAKAQASGAPPALPTAILAQIGR